MLPFKEVCMVKTSIFSSILVFLFLSSGMSQTGMKPVLDKYGNETGSYNVNPDPNGEPWIITPPKINSEVQSKLESIPEWTPSKGLAKAAALPRAVDHTKEPEYRPIFSQVGGSCSVASGTGYVYTWESNIVTGDSGRTNRSMYFYGYNFLNKGSSDNGCWWFDAWDIYKSTGCVREANWPSKLGSEKATEWANTYEAYHNANFARCSTYTKITSPGSTTGLLKVKQWLFDHGRGDAKGGCLEMNAGIDFGIQTVPSGSAAAGTKIATKFDGPNTIHAMHYAGYNDDVYYDPNHKGALLLVNSWGTSFGTQGKLWIPYNLFANETEVYCLSVKKHIPRLEFKVTLQNYGKNGGSFTSGFATSSTASSPATTQTYARAFTNNSGTFTGEIGLDITKAWSELSANKMNGKFFLQSRGTGTISSLSLMVYDSTGRTLLKEIKCNQTNIPLGTTMTIVLKDIVGVNAPQVARVNPKGITIRQLAGGYSIYVPFSGKSQVSLIDLNGREISSFSTTSSNWYTIPTIVRSAVHFVKVRNGNKSFVKMVNAVM